MPSHTTEAERIRSLAAISTRITAITTRLAECGLSRSGDNIADVLAHMDGAAEALGLPVYDRAPQPERAPETSDFAAMCLKLAAVERRLLARLEFDSLEEIPGTLETIALVRRLLAGDA